MQKKIYEGPVKEYNNKIMKNIFTNGGEKVYHKNSFDGRGILDDIYILNGTAVVASYNTEGSRTVTLTGPEENIGEVEKIVLSES